eukprot:CAMPEP_0206225962 /NCGR_PEP_ID=MMETSP0047_2-20121206/7823_1 /ASSEMBLY_ACC=CAM_ASM_000192 /TAXON_ID=195065 /ORGANISM="Chroomonas mesostigmatica_cf, Strain CCMP1168" /LENGTH=58 /DNA_ID=CAMNT_0053648989 /DNA_START=134 /DNA_END=306 /DNA_ORIENTATION=+
MPAHASIDLRAEWGFPYPEGSQYTGDVDWPKEGSEAWQAGLKETNIPNGTGVLKTPNG